MLWVTFVFAKIEIFDKFFNVLAKSFKGFALKLSQPGCLPHES